MVNTVKKTIMKRLASIAVGAVFGCSVMGIGFAASPQISDDGYAQGYVGDVWTVVMNEAQQEDLEIMSEYMDAELLAYASENADTVGDILKEYCMQDGSFYEVVYDYFAPTE